MKPTRCNHPGPDAGPDELRRTLLALLPTLLLASEAGAQDATKAQPGAYRIALDNEHLRVLDFRSRPTLGVCGVGMHSHPAHLTVALTPAKVRETPLGGKPFVVEVPAGTVFWSEAQTHETENIGGKESRALLIELKALPAAPTAKA